MTATGLSAAPDEYFARLQEQSDEQIDAWVAELMRDLSIRAGVRQVLRGWKAATGLDEPALERTYAGGGGPPATVGRTAEGEIMVPAVALHHLVGGLRREVPDARARMTGYLVANFHEIVYI